MLGIYTYHYVCDILDWYVHMYVPQKHALKFPFYMVNFVAFWRHMAILILLNIGLCYGLLPGDAKT